MGLFDFAESVFDSVSDVVSDTASFAGRTVSDVADAACGAVSSVGSAVCDVAEFAGSAVCDAADFAGDAMSSAGKAVSGAAEFVGETVCSAGNAACDAAERGINLVSDTIDIIDEPVSRAADFADNATQYIPEIIKFLNPAFGPVTVLTESFIDNVLRDPVTPVFGSVLYVDLAFGSAEHSGIYVGGGEKCIVELTNQGGQCVINLVSPDEFISGGTGFSIYVSSHHGYAVGKKRAAKRALSMVGCNLGTYNIALNNCHMFTNYCLRKKGCDDDSSGFSAFLDMEMTLTSIKNRARKVMDADEWRVWHYKD
ncbi:hypothetical protein [Succinimonas sp.]|uniref:hypothetical protein n=1 Tax=Succinimonas sp. TaxID=1936151 RepID=UPI0038692055